MACKTALHEADPEAARAALSIEAAHDSTPAGASSGASGAAGESTASVQLGLFLFFTLVRAFHPLVIEESKVDIELSSGETKSSFAYEAISVPLTECAVSLVVGQGLCLLKGGLEEWREIWRPAPMSVFSTIGFVYAFGDFLEVQSLGSLSGVMYQVLSQSKLIVTAFMIWVVKGQKQATLQWILLVLLMLSLICFALMKDLLEKHARAVAGGSPESDAAAISIPDGGTFAFGILMATLKVTVSCFCAVLSDKYMKDYKSEPIYMHLVRFKASQLATLLALSLLCGGEKLWSQGLFHDWSTAVVASSVSFTVKGWSTMYLLAILDSMLKNLGEACTVLVTYFLAVLHPGRPDEYDFEAFMTLVVVFVSIIAYLTAKDVVEATRKKDHTNVCRA